MDVNYDLKGLRLVFTGFILQMIAAFLGSGTISGISKELGKALSSVDSQSSGMSILSVVSGAVALVALILIIVGLSRLKRVSPYFRQSRNLYIADILVAVALVVVVMVMAGSALASASSSTLTGNTSIMSGILGMTLLAVAIVIVAMAVISILAIRSLMFGCGVVAAASGDYVYKEKCHRTWKLFLLSKILVVVALAVLVVTGLTSVISDFNSTGSVDIGAGLVTGGLLAAVVFFIVAAIMAFIAQIQLLMRTWGTYKRFNA